MRISAQHFLSAQRSGYGFTIIEMMITVTIIAIIIGLATPSYQHLVSNNRLIVTNNDLMTSLALARQNAISYAKDVYLCELLDEKTCNEKRPFNADWSKGWMVFIDNNRNALLDDKDTISYVSYKPNQKGIAIVFNQQGRLRFRPDGSARSAGFYLCSRERHKHIFLLYSGRARHNDSLTEKQLKNCHEKLTK